MRDILADLDRLDGWADEFGVLHAACKHCGSRYYRTQDLTFDIHLPSALDDAMFYTVSYRRFDDRIEESFDPEELGRVCKDVHDALLARLEGIVETSFLANTYLLLALHHFASEVKDD